MKYWLCLFRFFTEVETIFGVFVGTLLVHFLFGEAWFGAFLFGLVGAGLFHLVNEMYGIVRFCTDFWVARRRAKRLLNYFKNEQMLNSTQEIIVESEENVNEI